MSTNPAGNPSKNTQLTFPLDAMSGSLGDFARTMSAGTEVPEEFYFAAGLTFLGATCGDYLKLNASLNVEPRLFTVLLGESADVKKSTALRNTADFFGSVWTALGEQLPIPSICHGAGSAEGLGSCLLKSPSVVLCYDELKAFVDKSKIESSTLLPMVTSLFEQTKYENTTKKKALKIDNAHLSMVGCCTTDTYSRMWKSSGAMSIGFLNRLFIVSANRKQRVSWPEPRDPAKVEEIRQRFVRQLIKLPLSLDMTPDAKQAWERWYGGLTASMHTRRLDSIGFRLLGLIALTTDKDSIDLSTVNTVVKILDYELTVRTLTDPIDADGKIAHLEEAIRRQLGSRGCLSERELRSFTNADRDGIWAFKAAFENLKSVKDICPTAAGKWMLSDGVSSKVSSMP
jgi:uncharacterized protein DUF3987